MSAGEFATPIYVRFSRPAHLDELHSCEYGSYEDCIGETERGEGYEDGKLHIVEIIDRSRKTSKTVVELRDQHEVDEFFAQAVSGTFGLYHKRVCQRIYDELAPHVSEEMRDSWIFKCPNIGL